MTFWDHLTTYDDRPVIHWQPGTPLPDMTGKALFLGSSATDDVPIDLSAWPLARTLDALQSQDYHYSIEALLIGPWWEGYGGYPGPLADPMRDGLIAISGRLPRLDVLFLGDIVQTEMMVSLITHCDYTPLLDRYQYLRTLHVRGSNGLRFENLAHSNLRHITIETGNLRQDALRDLLRASLPNLSTLNLYIGTQEYGGDTSVADLMPLLSGRLFPELRHLALCNSDYADDIAEALAGAPILSRLESLDLSKGTMTDAGAAHILENPAFAAIPHIDLGENFITERLKSRLAELPNKITWGYQNEPWEDWDNVTYIEDIDDHVPGELYYCSVAE